MSRRRNCDVFGVTLRIGVIKDAVQNKSIQSRNKVSVFAPAPAAIIIYFMNISAGFFFLDTRSIKSSNIIQEFSSSI